MKARGEVFASSADRADSRILDLSVQVSVYTVYVVCFVDHKPASTCKGQQIQDTSGAIDPISRL